MDLFVNIVPYNRFGICKTGWDNYCRERNFIDYSKSVVYRRARHAFFSGVLLDLCASQVIIKFCVSLYESCVWNELAYCMAYIQ